MHLFSYYFKENQTAKNVERIELELKLNDFPLLIASSTIRKKLSFIGTEDDEVFPKISFSNEIL